MNNEECFKKFSHLNYVSDSRKADEHSVFFALRGSSFDGHDYIRQVLGAGCSHFVVEDDSLLKNEKNIAFIKVKNCKKEWAKAWREKAQMPDSSLFLVGVTGTNGKTSVSMMTEHILNHCGHPCGVMGTIDHHLKINEDTNFWESELTTPGAEILYPRLKEMRTRGASAVVMEISSHALDQERADGLQLDAAIFTNLTEDHLDYHINLEAYFEAKKKLFDDLLFLSEKKNKTIVLNGSDPRVRNFNVSFGTSYRVFNNREEMEQYLVDSEIRLNKEANQSEVACAIELIKHDYLGLDFDLIIKNSQQDLKINFKLPLIGRFQAMNWVQSFLSVKDKIKDISKAQQAALTFNGIPGRLQKVVTSKAKNIFIDYAHTPDALKSSLLSLKDICAAQLIVVFGCGGDRDTEKRPLMGRIAEEFSDLQIITNDNPRSESPEKIAEQISKGFLSKTPEIILDRKAAIEKAMSLVRSEKDIILIAGKGHENYQIIGNKKIDFSDYKCALELIEKA